jgi:hypothetical protein
MVEYEVIGRVAVITINRPEARNTEIALACDLVVAGRGTAVRAGAGIHREAGASLDGALITRDRSCCASMTRAASGSLRWIGPQR